MKEYKGPDYKFVQDIRRIVEEEGPEGLTNREPHNPLVRMDMACNPEESRMARALFQLYDEYLRWQKEDTERHRAAMALKLGACMDAVRDYFLNTPEETA